MGAMLKNPDDHLERRSLLPLQTDGVPKYVAFVVEGAIHIPALPQ